MSRAAQVGASLLGFLAASAWAQAPPDGFRIRIEQPAALLAPPNPAAPTADAGAPPPAVEGIRFDQP
ncbi:MAG: hypothetical protein KC620_14920, partial [Myxococcales bacterium]|nr:hypothetical protein [Myxococcales bacterium]